MTKIIMFLFCCLTLVSCGPSKSKMVELAKENLTLNIDNPQQLKIIATSERLTQLLARVTSPRQKYKVSCEHCRPLLIPS